MSATESLTYEQACEAHEWRVPERYNIAADVCDRQPGERTAMVFEDFRGSEREVSWAEQQGLANRAANRSRGVERGDRVTVCAPASPETAAMFLGTWKGGAILLSLSVLYGDDGIEHRIRDSQPRVIVINAENAEREHVK
jgi:acetyl-CoA synthetase